MKIDKNKAASTISKAMDCLEHETQLRLYKAIMLYLISGEDARMNFDVEERGMLTLMFNLIDSANEE